MFFSEYYSFSLELVQMLQIVPIKLLMLVTGVTWAGALLKTSVEHTFATPAELMQFSISFEELIKLCCYHTLLMESPSTPPWTQKDLIQDSTETERSLAAQLLLHFLDLVEKLLQRVEANQLDGHAITKIDGFSYYCQNMLTDFSLLCWPCCILLHILQWRHQPWQLYVVMCE